MKKIGEIEDVCDTVIHKNHLYYSKLIKYRYYGIYSYIDREICLYDNPVYRFDFHGDKIGIGKYPDEGGIVFLDEDFHFIKEKDGEVYLMESSLKDFFIISLDDEFYLTNTIDLIKIPDFFVGELSSIYL